MSKLSFGRYDYATFMTFIAYAVCSIVIPMCLVPLAADLHFPLDGGGMAKGGALQLARSIPMVLSLVLCGFLAGRWGKRKSLGLSILLMAAGILIAAVTPLYGILFLALIATGLGEGVIEGLVTPFVQDLHPEQPGRYLNLSHSFWSVGVVVLVLAAGALLQIGVSWRIIVGAAGVLAIIPALLFLAPNHSASNPDHAEERLNWREVANNSRDIMRQRRFWLYFAAMFFAGGAEFCLTFWCASFIQLAYGGSAWAAGLGTAVFAAGMFCGRIGSAFFVRQEHLQRLIVVMAALGTLISLFLPFLNSVNWLYPLLFVAGISAGPFWPSIQSHGQMRTPGDITMMMVLFSCAGVPGCGFFTWLMGVLGDVVGLRMSFLMIPACFLVVVGLICWDWRAEVRENGMHADTEQPVVPPVAVTPAVAPSPSARWRARQ